MNQAEEILNIDYHRKRLTLKALHKTRTVKEAAIALGLGVRQLYRDKIRYDITLDKRGNYVTGESDKNCTA